MELTGKIIAIMPERGGISQRTGQEWRVGEYVLEVQNERYTQRMAFEVFGADKIQEYAIYVGMMAKVYFDIDAREVNGRWFTSIRAWKVEKVA